MHTKRHGMIERKKKRGNRVSGGIGRRERHVWGSCVGGSEGKDEGRMALGGGTKGKKVKHWSGMRGMQGRNQINNQE